MNTNTQTLNLNSWTDRNGNTRRYVNNWADLVGLEIEYYKTGSPRSATINGESISNAAARRLSGVKVWLDDADQVHVDHWQDGTERYAITEAKIVETIEAILAPAVEETEQVEDPELAAIRTRKLRVLKTVDALIADMDAKRAKLFYAAPYIAWLRQERRIADEATAWGEYLELYRHWMTADLHGADARAAVANLKR